jgi:histone H3/H4
MNAIKVEVKQVYGNQMIYPVCDSAKTFAALAGKKTLSVDDIKKIRSLGFTVEQVQSIVI